ncbi:MAG: hypothetical protein WAN48_01645 [Actinomycetes bacterium]
MLSALALVGGATAVVAPNALATQEAPRTCYQGAVYLTSGDGQLTGPVSTLGNFTVYASTDGTCTAPIQSFATVVKGKNQAAAMDTCASLGYFSAVALGYYYPKTPRNWWWCSTTGG